jgi:hypothetical protein
MFISRFLVVPALALVAGSSPFAVLVAAPARAERIQERQPAGGPFGDLGGALMATPGCLGVESAMTESGKSLIFAWFEDKKAALRWYWSDKHQEMMERFFPDLGTEKPLAHIPDDSGPLMLVASITFSDEAPPPGVSLPISQIAIEIYAPQPGGISLGGSFAPPGLKVPGRRDSPLSAAGAAEKPVR